MVEDTHTHTYLYSIITVYACLLRVPGPFLVWSGTVVLVVLVSAAGADAGAVLADAGGGGAGAATLKLQSGGS